MKTVNVNKIFVLIALGLSVLSLLYVTIPSKQTNAMGTLPPTTFTSPISPDTEFQWKWHLNPGRGPNEVKRVFPPFDNAKFK